jgi:glycosyltransferase involved in cell wall biosynthesis
VRILFVNKYLYPKGGSETHLLGLAGGLTQLGHQCSFFGMEHAENVTPSGCTVTVPFTDYRALAGWKARIETFAGMLFSLPAYQRLRDHLARCHADVAHLHNVYHQLSPSVLVALGEAGIPCVLTAHDYKLVCPSYALHDGISECFACRGHKYWKVLRRGCSRRGLAGDVVLTVEAYVHHFARFYERYLARIVAPSRFLADRLVEGGFSRGRVRVIPNAVSVSDYVASPAAGDYFLFVGRLSHEKGIATLLAAARHIPGIPIWLVGDGPLRADLEQQAAGLGNVRFLGSQSQSEVQRLLRTCRAAVLPSHVPENCPLSLLEAFATSKPAIATRVGGIPELVVDGQTGIVVPPGDAEALARAMRHLWEQPEQCRRLGVQARRRAERQYDQGAYIAELLGVYDAVRRHTPGAGKTSNRSQPLASVSCPGPSSPEVR